MTPTEACALLERHRDMWPEWMVKAQPSMGVLGIFAETPPIYLINLGDPKRRNGRVVYVRPGLPDEENVRRILAAAARGYRQRQRQAEKKRNTGVMSANRLAVSQLKKSGAARWFETKQPNGRGTS